MRRYPDFYTKQAHAQGYLARSAFKLQEILQDFPHVRNAERILDLGAAPGAWSQVCLEMCPRATLVAADLNELRFRHDRLQFIQGNIQTTQEELAKQGPFDLVLSDMAPATTGLRDSDAERSLTLARLALLLARHTLSDLPQSIFVVKLYMGSDFSLFLQEVKDAFGVTRNKRPASTRKNSREIFIVAHNKRA